MDKVFLTPKDFAAWSGIGICRVREMCGIDGFPAAKNGNRYLIHRERAIDWMMAHKSQTHKHIRD